MTAYDPSNWSDFAVAQLGASAALLGLVFVGLSINLRDFVSSGVLVDRAAESVVVLGSALAASTAVLVPDQSHVALGIELGIVACATLGGVLRFQRHPRAASDATGVTPPLASVVTRRLLGLGTPIVLLVAAVTLLAEGGGGLYWWPVALLAAYASALSNAWVLLIEILR
jgi:modulator of FtsH protease